MFRGILAGTMAIAAALPLSIVTASEAAAADDVDRLKLSGRGSCVQARGWGSAGAFSIARADDYVRWNGRRHLHIYWSKAKAELRSCDSRGALVKGGKVKIGHSWTVEGTHVGSCDLGWGLKCTLSDYAEKSSFSVPWRSNTAGWTSYNFGEDDVYARSTDTGKLDAYTHRVSVRFVSPSGSAETRSAVSVRLRRGHN
ncbi:hypothetical protein ACFCV3_02065 [Kribbella sp. NPDC056345]|uniref:hypothetical protein n=1 Tax=Kribbella sp. NPDC056345 TaxID=3345789 RepID=UPI0035D646A5